MPLYENTVATVSAEVLEPTYEGNPYEEPISTFHSSQQRSESVYFEPSSCLSQTHSQSTDTSVNTDQHEFQKIGRTPRLRCHKTIIACLIFLIALVILSIAASATSVILYVKNSNKPTNETLKREIEDFVELSQAMDKLRQDTKDFENLQTLKFRESLKIYNWYQASNQHWYMLFPTRLSYDQAKYDCQILGTRLASSGIRNPEIKNEIISEILVGLQNLSPVWIGLEDAEDKFYWEWSDGTASRENETDWKDGGAPIDYLDNQRCGLMTKAKDWKIVNRDCDKTFQYLCETKSPVL